MSAEPPVGNKIRTVLPLRRAYDGSPIKVFSSFGKRPKLTLEARISIALDYYELELQLSEARVKAAEEKAQNASRTKRQRQSASSASPKPSDEGVRPPRQQQKGTYLQIAEHYGVHKQTVYQIIQDAKKKSKLPQSSRPGAPVQMQPEVRLAIKNEFNDKKGRISLKRLSKALEGITGWSTKRKGKLRTSPSTATLSRLLNCETFQIGSIRTVPTLNDKALHERRSFPVFARALNDHVLCTHDEAYVQVRWRKGRIIFDLSLPRNNDEAPVVVEPDGGGQAEPKVFLFGSYSKPRIVEMDGSYYFDPLFDGRVALFRVRGVRPRKVNRLGKLKGDPIYENVTINGARYKQLFEMTGGYFDYIEMYFNPSLRNEDYCTARVLALDLTTEPDSVIPEGPLPSPTIWCQEDGAPGHGFDNIHNKGTTTHEALVRAAALRGIALFKQPRHSPEMNAMDLGGWRMLKTAVENRSNDVPYFNGKNRDVVEAKIWEIVKDEWVNHHDPKKVFMIFEQRRVLLDEIERVDGGIIRSEPHSGLRKKFQHIRNDPELVKSIRATNQERVSEVNSGVFSSPDEVAALFSTYSSSLASGPPSSSS